MDVHTCSRVSTTSSSSSGYRTHRPSVTPVFRPFGRCVCICCLFSFYFTQLTYLCFAGSYLGVAGAAFFEMPICEPLTPMIPPPQQTNDAADHAHVQNIEAGPR